MKPPQNELVADGNRQKPPRAKSVPSTTSSDALTFMGDIDNDISTSASESYPQEESSSNEDSILYIDQDGDEVDCIEKENENESLPTSVSDNTFYDINGVGNFQSNRLSCSSPYSNLSRTIVRNYDEQDAYNFISDWASTAEDTSSFYDDQSYMRKSIYDPEFQSITSKQSSCDNSTCCDEDFTWVCNQKEKAVAYSLKGALKHSQGDVDDAVIKDINTTTKREKIVRPSVNIEQRRIHSRSRKERDNKSCSAHSLQESSATSTTDYASPQQISGVHRPKRMANSESIPKHHSKHHVHSHYTAHRPKMPPPIFWERPYFPSWDPNVHYINYHSQDDNYFNEFYNHRTSHNDCCRYDSDSNINVNQPKLLLPPSASPSNYGTYCSNRFYTKPPPIQHQCYPCNRSTSSIALPNASKFDKAEISDERSHLSDKELLAHQVHILTKQVSAQNEKINDLERLISDKAQHVSNTEELLQRERLSRSSLETQKLELMSAMSELKLQQAVLERENLELRASHFNNNTIATDRKLPPVPNARIRTNSTSGSMTPPSSYRRQVDIHYNSLPRASLPTTSTPIQSGCNSANSSIIDSNANPKRNAVAFGKQLTNQYIPHSATKSASNICHQQMVLYQQPKPTSSLCHGFQKQKGVSVPNLAQTEKIIDDTDLRQQSSPSPSISSKSKSLGGLRSIFGKLRRSNSGNLEELPLDGSEFRRGGIRATAGPRLGWNNAPTTDVRLINERTNPFTEWSVDAVCAWFEEMGLGIYDEDLRKWLKNGGADLVNVSSFDIEKEINLKSSLHSKKIVLALSEVTGKDTDELFINSGKLDTVWVMRWLDDIGLPQHKDNFSNARIDGRMLHRLTLEDLATLHVTSSLHAASLRRAIQVMRENKWNPDCLVRRSYNHQIEDEKYSDCNLLKDLHLWTAHRVMEWLRVVNLAEYAPNLRGAGVHGALMVYEDRFTDEILADLLSIPSTKSLIRRHLCTHFKDLLGREIIQNKRKAETTLGYQPLTLTSKIKTPKKSQFTLKRKKNQKPIDEWGDLLCPLDDESNTNSRRRGCFSGE
ncbi:liprin-beta-2 isoform X5 [Contarinia nasturtii]|uniref:liprin-beta-2 isoform X5 n=1 Tax=Contarinia nasturtii TaxID=265458 RepID=UPI0012D42CEB|nr:liprin-beta-2 isoform X5 [Contarinia nasturtii]